jgi:transcriptional regulator with XRE-family HTH domain
MTGKLFADNLRRLREARKLTQESLSECLGVSIVTIQNWENQRRFPDAAAIDKIGGFFEVSSSTLFARETERPTITPEEAVRVLDSFFERRNKLHAAPLPADPLIELIATLTTGEREMALRLLETHLRNIGKDSKRGTRDQPA